jgi:hypothetical protein
MHDAFLTNAHYFINGRSNLVRPSQKSLNVDIIIRGKKSCLEPSHRHADAFEVLQHVLL